MAHGDLVFDVDVGQERAFVVDAEVEDTMVVRYSKGNAEKGAVAQSGDRGQFRADIRGEHGELKLDSIIGKGEEGAIVISIPFGELKVKGLRVALAFPSFQKKKRKEKKHVKNKRTTLFLIR